MLCYCVTVLILHSLHTLPTEIKDWLFYSGLIDYGWAALLLTIVYFLLNVKNLKTFTRQRFYPPPCRRGQSLFLRPEKSGHCSDSKAGPWLVGFLTSSKPASHWSSHPVEEPFQPGLRKLQFGGGAPRVCIVMISKKPYYYIISECYIWFIFLIYLPIYLCP